MPKKGSTKAGARAGKAKTATPKVKKVPAELKPIAREVDVRLEKADKDQGRADDHRLAAALKLAEAKDICLEAGVSFQKWCEENVTHAWVTVRSLAAIGSSEDPEGAIKFARNETAKRVAAHRERKRVADANAARVSGSAKPEEVVRNTLEQLPEKKAVAAVKSAMGSHGLELVTEQEAREIAGQKKMKPLDRAKFAFLELSNNQVTEFMLWVAEEIGYDITYMGQPLKKSGRKKVA